MKRRGPSLEVILGMAPKGGGPEGDEDMATEMDDEGGGSDDAIANLFDALQEGDREAFATAFRDAVSSVVTEIGLDEE